MAEILILLVVAAAVALVVVTAKRGAEAAQRDREQRWGGFSGTGLASSERPGPLQPGGGSARMPSASSPSSQRVPGTIPAPTPPDSAGERPQPAAAVGGAGRQVLSALRGSQPEVARSGQAVGVAARSAGPSAVPRSRPPETARAPGAAAQAATSPARAARSQAPAALWRSPAPVDINRAAVDDLQSLPGVGIRAAERIVAHRERHGDFASVNDLVEVAGFDQHRVNRLAPRARV